MRRPSQCLRRLQLDFHNPTGIPDVGYDFDGKEFARILKGSGFDSVTVFAQCSHGYSYFPTKVGIKHPNLKRDLLGEMIEACHSENITIGAYISVGCSDFAKQEWLQVDSKGKPRSFEEQGGYTMVCLNSPYIENNVLPITSEVVENYEIDSVFYDLLFFHDEGCYCKYCIERMKKFGLNPEFPEDIRKHMKDSIDEFVDKTCNVVNNIKPYVEIVYNGLSVSERPRGIGKSGYVDIESLATGGWGYFYFPAKASYIRTLGKPVSGMTAAFHRSWGDFGTVKSRTMLEYECRTIIASGCAVEIGDQLHPKGKLEKAKYKIIGEVLNPIRKLEPWIKGAKPLTEAAIVLHPLAQGQFPSESWAGACKLLMEAKVQFDTVDKESDWSRYKLLVFADKVYNDEKVKGKLAKYLNSGGSVLATGDAISILPSEIVVKTGEPVFSPVYFRIKGELLKDIPDIPHIVNSGFIQIESSGADVLATLIKPYPEQGEKFFFSAQIPYYEDTDIPFIIKKGNLIYIASQLFSEYWEIGYGVHRKLLMSAINTLLLEPLTKSKLPLNFELAVLEQNNRLICHIVPYFPVRGEHVEQIEEWPSISGMSVGIKGNFKEVYLAPEQQKLIFSFDSSYTIVDLPPLLGPIVVVFEK